MSKHNILDVTFAALDDKGDLIKEPDKGLSTDGIYVADHRGEGFATANITAIEAAGTPGWANGKIKRIAYPKSVPSIELTALDLDWGINNKLRGYVQDAKSGAWLLQTPKPHIALIIRSQAFDNSIFYECFNNVEFVQETSKNATDNKEESDDSTSLIGQALTPLKSDIFVNPNNNLQQPYMIANSADKGFDLTKLYAEVFGGYVLTPAPKPLSSLGH
ncbi:phage tail protein [Lactiplantibacillus plantarum]|uniref:phage tail protein n=1 Tax=Lactiplantibacillus plantarum TaxID=1590 RepID=UPI0007BB5DF6|nr:phage tail protein [Lactiplantibacillus plantarum]KZU84728.1 Phage major tail protein [Lactiplantibacillus plantarum]